MQRYSTSNWVVVAALSMLSCAQIHAATCRNAFDRNASAFELVAEGECQDLQKKWWIVPQGYKHSNTDGYLQAICVDQNQKALNLYDGKIEQNNATFAYIEAYSDQSLGAGWNSLTISDCNANKLFIIKDDAVRINVLNPSNKELIAYVSHEEYARSDFQRLILRDAFESQIASANKTTSDDTKSSSCKSSRWSIQIDGKGRIGADPRMVSYILAMLENSHVECQPTNTLLPLAITSVAVGVTVLTVACCVLFAKSNGGYVKVPELINTAR